jgi:5-formyltetrahydrofolate cyclo-ligase
VSKNELRKNVIAGRNALSGRDVAEKSKIIAGRIMKLKEYQNALTVMAYIDFRNEVQTEAIIQDALRKGKRVAIPITDIRNKKLIPSLLENYPGDLAPGTWGILEPKPGCIRPVEPGEIDLVIVPGVAFDTAGNRLGYGGGFYDRFLPRTRRDTVFLSPAFELQVRPNVYPGKHDIPIHLLVTEDRVLDFRHIRQ